MGLIRLSADDFARNDPYVKDGLVNRWYVKPWNVVFGRHELMPDTGRQRLPHRTSRLLRGKVTLNGSPLKEGDGAAVSSEQELHFMGDAPEGGEVLLFDLP